MRANGDWAVIPVRLGRRRWAIVRRPCSHRHPQLDCAMKLVSLLDMKATIDFDPVLYRRLKVEAARRGRTVRDLVAEGVELVLERLEAHTETPDVSSSVDEWRPAWLGSLRQYAANANGKHDLASMRASVARGRSRQ